MSNGKIAIPKCSECFVCSGKNPIGLDLMFYYFDGKNAGGKLTVSSELIADKKRLPLAYRTCTALEFC